jgi:hypothetical protein
MRGVFNNSSVFNRLGYDFFLIVVFIFASMSMEMTSSIVSDLRPFVQRRDLLSGINDRVERLKFYRYGPSDLAWLD